MKNETEQFCVECGKTARFIFEDEQWICEDCGSYNSQGDLEDSIPENTLDY